MVIENKNKLKEFCEEREIKHIQFDIDRDNLDKIEKLKIRHGLE